MNYGIRYDKWVCPLLFWKGKERAAYFIADPEGNVIGIGSWNKPYDIKDEEEG